MKFSLKEEPVMSDEIPVTEEMKNVGLRTAVYGRGTVSDVYRAMATARGAIKLSSDQITWFNNVVAMLPEKNREIATLQADNRSLEAENAALKQGLDHAGDIIAALQLKLAKATVFVDPAPEPPKSNPFRDFPVDRRRMGPNG